MAAYAYVRAHPGEVALSAAIGVVGLVLVLRGARGAARFRPDDLTRQEGEIIGEQPVGGQAGSGDRTQHEYLVRLPGSDAFATVRRTYGRDSVRPKVGGRLTVVRADDGRYVDEVDLVRAAVGRYRRDMVLLGLVCVGLALAPTVHRAVTAWRQQRRG